jgi:hypothetical protein
LVEVDAKNSQIFTKLRSFMGIPKTEENI